MATDALANTVAAPPPTATVPIKSNPIEPSTDKKKKRDKTDKKEAPLIAPVVPVTAAPKQQPQETPQDSSMSSVSAAKQAEAALKQSLQKAKSKQPASISTSQTTAPASTNTPALVSVADEPPKNGAPLLMHKATQLLKKAAIALGPARAIVDNQSPGYVCVITFNKADILLSHYTNMYVVDPNQRVTVEAISDPIGLFVAIVYKAADGYLHYKRWLCKNDAEMVVQSVASMYDIVVNGGNFPRSPNHFPLDLTHFHI